MGYNPYSLEGKTVLITGASSGIGRAMAVECSRMEARVVATGRDRQRLSETLGFLDGGGHLSVACDLNEREEVSRLVEGLPPLDGFVVNAGCNRRMLCQYIKEEGMDLVVRTNLVSPILLTKALLKSKTYTVQQVSIMLNFANASFFGKYFKSATGVSPRRYMLG